MGTAKSGPSGAVRLRPLLSNLQRERLAHSGLRIGTDGGWRHPGNRTRLRPAKRLLESGSGNGSRYRRARLRFSNSRTTATHEPYPRWQSRLAAGLPEDWDDPCRRNRPPRTNILG